MACAALVHRRFNEAAALLPRKAGRGQACAHHRQCASMRPRHCCRGRPRSRRPWGTSAPGFNEAAALLPRKASSRISAAARCFSRFNEAAALLPRKAWEFYRADYLRPGFNEAAALLPRKALVTPSWTSITARSFNEAAALLPRKASARPGPATRPAIAAASMRPRHCCRGRPRSGRRSCRHRGRFNEAAALLPRKARRRWPGSWSTAPLQ